MKVPELAFFFYSARFLEMYPLCTYQCQALPTTPRGYVGIGWELDTFGSRLPRTSGRATSQILVEYHVIQAIRVAY